MTKPLIPLALARRIALNAQLLDGRAKLPKGKEGVAQAIEELGCVQIDTIAVIQRAHHHTLWTRRHDYAPEMLHELQAADRRVFEYWGRALSYVPMSDYRFYLPRMRNFDDPKTEWTRRVTKECGHLMKPILERIRAEGPLGLKDLAPAKREKRGATGLPNPTRFALDMLLGRGDLMVTERRETERIYDLTERVLPESVDTNVPTDDEVGRFLVRRALKAYGVANETQIRVHMQPEAARDSHYRAVGKDVISKAIAELVDAGEVAEVGLENDSDCDYFALSETMERSSTFKPRRPTVHLLSPFDGLVAQRARVRGLFGFDYTLECYLPAAKRKHGFFVLPILWGENLVGRLDPAADRESKTLVIHNLLFEPGVEAFDEFLPAFSTKLWSFAEFNECESIKLKKTSPARIKTALERLLKKAT